MDITQSTVFYDSQEVKSRDAAVQYCKTHESSHRYLAYRDIPAIVQKYSCSGKALDYGTGTGCSAKFLYSIGFEVVAVDTSLEMLTQAKLQYPDFFFDQVQDGVVPLDSESVDLVFSSFVLFEIGNENDIISYLQEAKRLLKRNGIFIAVTGSQNLHSPFRDWLSFNCQFQVNNNLSSGDLAKLYLYDADMEFTDYYWSELDYRKFFALAGVELLEIIYPLGKESDPYNWKDEKKVSPFVILVGKSK